MADCWSVKETGAVLSSVHTGDGSRGVFYGVYMSTNKLTNNFGLSVSVQLTAQRNRRQAQFGLRGAPLPCGHNFGARQKLQLGC